MTMDVRAYRERPTSKDAGKSHARELWVYLQSQSGTRDKAVGRAAAQTSVKGISRA